MSGHSTCIRWYTTVILFGGHTPKWSSSSAEEASSQESSLLSLVKWDLWEETALLPTADDARGGVADKLAVIAAHPRAAADPAALVGDIGFVREAEGKRGSFGA